MVPIDSNEIINILGTVSDLIQFRIVLLVKKFRIFFVDYGSSFAASNYCNDCFLTAECDIYSCGIYVVKILLIGIFGFRLLGGGSEITS